MKPQGPDSPIKSVVDKDGKDINHQIVKDGDNLQYNIDQQVGVLDKTITGRYKSFSIVDKLDSNLSFKNARVINLDTKKEISKSGEITFNKDTRTVQWNASGETLKNLPLNGETYELQINAKVHIPDENSNPDSNQIIKNTATVNIENSSKDTNTP